MNRMVAICDILGFRDVVVQRPLDYVVISHLGILRRTLGWAVHHPDSFPEEIPELRELRDQRRVGLAWFSDTVLIFANDGSPEASRDVLETVGWLLLSTMLRTQIRLRAGVDYGELYVDEENAIYVGKSLVRAYLLQDAQDWAGGALTPQAVAEIPSSHTRKDLTVWWVCPYDVPLKPDRPEAMSGGVAINWTTGFHKKTDIRWNENSAEPSESEWAQMQTICRRWEHVRLFHRRVCEHCRHESIEWGA